ncbi:MAG: DUF2169 domain-containing protein [Desulfovibrionaceae bacterium]|nr:DUF2169 domain-containing protein [Desulfovibrionaceae bacterium]
MNIHKPDTLSFMAQPLDWRGTLHQSFTVGLGFDLLRGGLLPADAALAAAMKALSPGDCLDMGVPKKQAEWLLVGSACAPGAEAVNRLAVDIRVGGSSRRFLVSDSSPFTSLPLIWEKTWGTAEENPQGLPMGQLERAPLSDEKMPFGAPACPGPRGAWPCRMKKMGSYDAAWLQNRWPGVPDDFDWAFFNLAQPVQYLPQGLRGDEAVELTCLHPEHPRLAVQLPGKQLRLHLCRGGQWSEMAVSADTLWLFPGELAGLILWHGLTPSVDEIGSDIEAVRLTLEPEEAEAAIPAPPEADAPAGQPAAATVAMTAGATVATAAVAFSPVSGQASGPEPVPEFGPESGPAPKAGPGPDSHDGGQAAGADTGTSAPPPDGAKPPFPPAPD